jgi:hypothetical protein
MVSERLASCSQRAAPRQPLLSCRTVYDVATGEKLERMEWAPVRGLEGTREASVTISPHPEGPLHNAQPVTVNIAVANGLGEPGLGGGELSGRAAQPAPGRAAARGQQLLWEGGGEGGGAGFSALTVGVPPVRTFAGNAKKLLKQVQEGEKEYHFIEVMACPGELGGGGGRCWAALIWPATFRAAGRPVPINK